jgi:hypothetical protein
MTTKQELYKVILVSNGAVLDANVVKAEAISLQQRYGYIGRNVKIERARRSRKAA